MNITTLFRRWMLLTFPPSPGKLEQRQLFLLWKTLSQEKPAWYLPVTDKLTPSFGLNLLNLKSSLDAVRAEFDLPAEGPTLVATLVDRLANRFLEQSHLTREQLTFERICEEVSNSRGVDYRGMEQLFQSRMKALLQPEIDRWNKSLPSFEALVHLVNFPWDELNALCPNTIPSKTRSKGSRFVDALEDLVYVLEPLTFDDSLTKLYQALVDDLSHALEPLAAARSSLIHEGRILNIIRAIREAPAHSFRRAAYRPPTLSTVFQALLDEFDGDLRKHRAESERLRLAERLKVVFHDRPLILFPAYNEETAAALLEKRLPELIHAGAIKVLYNFKEFFHVSLFQKFFQEFQLRADFLSNDAGDEFKDALEDYFQMIALLNKFAEDLLSPSYSPLTSVLNALKLPFLEAKTKQSLRKPIENLNRWADEICQKSYRTVRRLHALLERYLLELNSLNPISFSGGKVFQTQHPEVVEGMKTGAQLLEGLSGILRQVVVDLKGD